MEQHGNRSTYNIETVLRKNIVDSEYWRNTCAKLQTWEEVVDQIFYDVIHVEPWMSGNARGASSAFGLLYRLCQLQPSEEQVDALLTHEDSPYIRAVGRLSPVTSSVAGARVLRAVFLSYHTFCADWVLVSEICWRPQAAVDMAKTTCSGF